MFVAEKSIDDLQALFASSKITSAALATYYVQRIEDLDRRGPTLRSVIALAPDWLEQAVASDKRRSAGKALGPLDGIPVLIKD
ncbi:MAG: amidase, partial [Sphingomonadales bacterium]